MYYIYLLTYYIISMLNFKNNKLKDFLKTNNLNVFIYRQKLKQVWFDIKIECVYNFKTKEGF